jgi:hypothetical protein
MELIDKNTFFNLVNDFEIIPYSQSKGMYAFHALKQPERILFFTDNTQHPSIACFGHLRKLFGKRLLMINGECYKDEQAQNLKVMRSFYSELTQSGFDFIEVCSNAPYSFRYEISMRQAGYLRPVGQFSMPVTKYINLKEPIEFDKNWRRNLKKAGQYGLSFEKIDSITMNDCIDFVTLYNGMVRRKRLDRTLSQEQIYALCHTGDFAIYFAIYKDCRISTFMIHKNKNHAGSWLSATSEEGLKKSAAYFVYEQLISNLKSDNYDILDMEKLVPSTSAVNNVFLFKDGIKGEHVILNGEWCWYKKKCYRPTMYFVKKYLIKKREL